jgi:hypothetical protein
MTIRREMPMIVNSHTHIPSGLVSNCLKAKTWVFANLEFSGSNWEETS